MRVKTGDRTVVGAPARAGGEYLSILERAGRLQLRSRYVAGASPATGKIGVDEVAPMPEHVHIKTRVAASEMRAAGYSEERVHDAR